MTGSVRLVTTAAQCTVHSAQIDWAMQRCSVRSARTCRDPWGEAEECGQRGQDRGQGHHDDGARDTSHSLSQPATCSPHVSCYASSHVSHWLAVSHMRDVSRPGLASILGSGGHWATLGQRVRPGLRERESWSSQPEPGTEALCPLRAGLRTPRLHNSSCHS